MLSLHYKYVGYKFALLSTVCYTSKMVMPALQFLLSFLDLVALLINQGSRIVLWENSDHLLMIAVFGSRPSENPFPCALLIGKIQQYNSALWGFPPPPFIEWKTYNTFTLIFHLQHFVNLFLPIENKEISLSVQNTIWCNRHCKKDKVKDIDLNSKNVDFFLSTWGSITHLFNMMIQSH